MNKVHLLLVSGSLRMGSSSTAALRTVQTLAPEGVSVDLYESLAALPHFNPDDDVEEKPAHPTVNDLRERLRVADGVIFSTPEYAGALPGAFKNLLEWTVGCGSLYGKPVAWLNVAGPTAPRGAADAHASLHKVLIYTGAVIVKVACARIPLSRQDVGAGGPLEDPALRKQFEEMLEVFLAPLGITDSAQT